jgi:hypothetical protein
MQYCLVPFKTLLLEYKKLHKLLCASLDWPPPWCFVVSLHVLDPTEVPGPVIAKAPIVVAFPSNKASFWTDALLPSVEPKSVPVAFNLLHFDVDVDASFALH